MQPADLARKEIRDMVDATMSIIVREYSVDEEFVVSEIKEYLNKPELPFTQKSYCQSSQYSSKRIGRFASIVSIVNTLICNVRSVKPI